MPRLRYHCRQHGSGVRKADVPKRAYDSLGLSASVDRGCSSTRAELPWRLIQHARSSARFAKRCRAMLPVRRLILLLLDDVHQHEHVSLRGDSPSAADVIQRRLDVKDFTLSKNNGISQATRSPYIAVTSFPNVRNAGIT